MRLKALEVQGYKSFANKVEFTFDEGITAVVGPNGSGKSNVADAIRWVLGEQSYSTLRGKKTEDMIFSGSEGRARLGMAAATLILDNTDKWLPLDFSEVTISRRAYRSGENEYYLNGSRVRLRDVAEILAKSGLGRQTYTVIGQGTIDRVLSLHADERRKLFEEAAGITFHRQQRAETLARLDTTHANLLRLNDIVKEIEPRLTRLERQAERTEEYNRLNTHLEGVLRLWYGYRWRQGQLQLEEAKSRLREQEAAVETQRSKLQQIQQEIGQLRAEQTRLRGQLGAWYAENNQLHAEAETVQRELAVSQERARQYAAQRAEILAELDPLQADLDKQQEQVRQAEAAYQAINQKLGQAEAAAGQIQQQLDALHLEEKAIRARQAEAEQQGRRLEAALAERQARLAQFSERSQALLAEQETGRTEMARLREQQAQFQEKQAQLKAALSALEGELLALETKHAAQHAELGQLNQVAEQLKGQLTALERKEETLKARQDWLGKLRSDMSGYYAGVRAVMQPEAGLSGIIGPLSQVIQAPPELELAIETALGGRLQDVVVDSFSQAEQAIAYLKENRAGRATFLPLDTIRPGKAVEPPATPGVVGLASELVSVEPRLRPIADQALNRTVVVVDLAAARRAFTAMQGGFQIVTRDGELMRSGGAVTGGRTEQSSKQEGTLLAREREWRELPAQIDKLAQSHHTLSGQLADHQEQAAGLKERLQNLAEQQQQKSRQQQEKQAELDKVDRSLEQLETNLNWQQELQDKAQAELDQLDRRRIETEAEITQLEQEKLAAAETVELLTAQVKALPAEKLLAELNQAQTSLATVRSQQKSQLAILENHRASSRQLSQQIETKQARVQSLAADLDALRQEQQERQEQNQSFLDELEQFAQKIKEVESRLAELETSLTGREQAENSARQRLHWLEGEQNRASLAAARRQDDLDNLQRQIQDDLGLVNLDMSSEQIGQPLLPIRPLVSDLPPVEELPPGVEEDVKRLKVQVRRLGHINHEAPREYQELRERHEFLTTQMADLEKAAADLKQIIARLDDTMREAFTATFEAVTKEFQSYFKTLFGGGDAQLLLTDPDNLIEAGVDIVARPPGKRLQSLALLSGGERSLTAQALIFALLKTSPTPFVIFDEVDAMLDEANVGRFREALVALSHDIQFIIITHNRQTIEAANTIYGISMNEASVSQIYSLKIEQWLEPK